MRIYAHRGAAAEFPENTMAAFERAISLGVDALELDVHSTVDGVVVVAHDPDGRRMAGEQAYLRDTPWSQVCTWDVGWGFLHDGERTRAECGHRMPQLADVLGAWPDISLNIDVKQESPSIVAAVLKVIREHNAEERTLLASFSQQTMDGIRSAGYGGPTGCTQKEVVRQVLLGRFGRVPGQRVQVPVRHGRFQLASSWFIRRCQRHGKAVDFWTIDEPEVARLLVDLGADGLMTNDPATILPVVMESLGQSVSHK
ncbi:MAG: glycerophosphodiester phosphodiesterase [Proteobacteria bacterium]|jgi:glycerophosphoryl diester phosphodiesterase|nr:glycerophosphodiester phosphodiesterase [Pseudomonadota bacterium]